MNSLIKYGLVFVLGAAAGAVVSWRILEPKYKQIADEEIESVKERFNNILKKEAPTESETEKNEPDQSEKDFKDYAKVLSNAKYTKYSNSESEAIQKAASTKAPYVITPEDFGESEYDTKEFTYYADGVLANEDDEALDDEDVEQLVGRDSLNTFGEYEDDSVYVRNEGMQVDYEILLDTRKYYDVFPRNKK